MLSNNPLLLDNGGGSSCIQGILNTKLAETIDMVLSDLVNFDKDSSVCSPCLCVRVLTPIPAACDQKSAQWNCSSCSRVMAYESCHSVWGLISLLLALSRVFSLCTRQLQDYITSWEHGLHLCVYAYFAICVRPVICCCFLHALWASQIILLTLCVLRPLRRACGWWSSKTTARKTVVVKELFLRWLKTTRSVSAYITTM